LQCSHWPPIVIPHLWSLHCCQLQTWLQKNLWVKSKRSWHYGIHNEISTLNMNIEIHKMRKILDFFFSMENMNVNLETAKKRCLFQLFLIDFRRLKRFKLFFRNGSYAFFKHQDRSVLTQRAKTKMRLTWSRIQPRLQGMGKKGPSNQISFNTKWMLTLWAMNSDQIQFQTSFSLTPFFQIHFPYFGTFSQFLWFF